MKGIMEESGSVLCLHPLVEGRHVRRDIPDLNHVPMKETDDRAIVPYKTPISEIELILDQPLVLFGAKILPSNVWPQNEEGQGVEHIICANLGEFAPTYENRGGFCTLIWL